MSAVAPQTEQGRTNPAWGSRSREPRLACTLPAHREEDRAQPGFDRREQYQHDGHAGVHVPVRHRPFLRSLQAKPCLVRQGVAREVRRLVRDRDDEAGCPVLELLRLVWKLRVVGHPVEPVDLVRLIEDHEVEALAEATRRRVPGHLQDIEQQVPRHRIGLKLTHHPAPPDQFAKLHFHRLPEAHAARS